MQFSLTSQLQSLLALCDLNTMSSWRVGPSLSLFFILALTIFVSNLGLQFPARGSDSRRRDEEGSCNHNCSTPNLSPDELAV